MLDSWLPGELHPEWRKFEHKSKHGVLSEKRASCSTAGVNGKSYLPPWRQRTTQEFSPALSRCLNHRTFFWFYLREMVYWFSNKACALWGQESTDISAEHLWLCQSSASRSFTRGLHRQRDSASKATFINRRKDFRSLQHMPHQDLLSSGRIFPFLDVMIPGGLNSDFDSLGWDYALDLMLLFSFPLIRQKTQHRDKNERESKREREKN